VNSSRDGVRLSTQGWTLFFYSSANTVRHLLVPQDGCTRSIMNATTRAKYQAFPNADPQVLVSSWTSKYIVFLVRGDSKLRMLMILTTI
jgi:hypothetical protein